jgi:hypothetical protein
VITFSACHEYGSESTISFEPPPEPAAPTTPRVRDVNLAAGLLVQVELAAAIDSKSASVGDAVQVRVRQDVRHGGELVLPVGALIGGRIRSLDRYSAPEPHFLMGIELSAAEWRNARVEFRGELIDSQGPSTTSPGDGILHIPGARFHLAPGFRMVWRTLGQQPSSDFR